MAPTSSLQGMLLALALATVPVAAHAQMPAPVHASTWFSAGLAYQRGCYNQFGSVCAAGLALGLGLGWAASSRVQLGVGSTGLLSGDDEGEFEIGGTFTGVVRVHPFTRARLLLTGGLGVGSVQLIPHQMGVAAEAGIGWDLTFWQRASVTPYVGIVHIGDPQRPTTYRQLGLAVTLD